MRYNPCDWCDEKPDVSSEYVLVDGYLRCCMDCWNNFGVKELIELHGDDYRVVED